MAKRHFHTFDALRFLAFLKVFLFHLPFVSFPLFHFFNRGGGIGVIFFFTLSGFLITWVLLEEKQQRGRISAGRFFLRRALRIWPLYYLMVAFAWATPYLVSLLGLTASDEGYAPNWLLSCLFLENYQMMMAGSFPNVSPLGVMWSVCVEEHFYLLWGLALALLPARRLPWLFGAGLLASAAARRWLEIGGLPDFELLSNLDHFVAGAWPAWLLSRRGEALTEILRKLPPLLPPLWLALCLAYVLAAPNIAYPGQLHLEPLLLDLLFAGLLLLLLPAASPLRIADGHPLSRAGRYTYGLYLYHTIVLNFLIQLYRKLGLPFDHAGYAVLYTLLGLALTFGAAILSYELFERPFLRLKARLGGR